MGAAHDIGGRGSERQLLGVTILVAAVYGAWLGATWLRLTWSGMEMPLFAARALDFREGLRQAGGLWWTEAFMCGSSQTLNLSQGLYLVPLLLLSPLVGMASACKLTALLAIGASGVTMHLFARRLFEHERAAALAAVCYLLHPQLLFRAGAVEHFSVVLIAPLAPLVWMHVLSVARRHAWFDVLACGLVTSLAVFTHNKLAFISIAYALVFALVDAWRRRDLRAVGALAAAGVVGALIAAFALVPQAIERPYVKLFEGSPLEGWQRLYSLGSPLELLRRGGGVYLGGAAFVLASVGAFGGFRGRSSFWTLVGLLLAAIAIAHYPIFAMLRWIPLVRDIRAPLAFFEMPGAMLVSLLAGFAWRDVVEKSRWRAFAVPVFAVTAGLFVLDGLAYHLWFRRSDVLPSTVEHARDAYAALPRAPEGGRVHLVTSRFFHMLSPSWGGPNLSTESSFAYMGARGTGLLAAASLRSAKLERSFLDVSGTRFLVFDKTDPASAAAPMQAQLAVYRRSLTQMREDEDLVVFENPTASPFVSGHRRQCLAFGDSHQLAELALVVAARGCVLVRSKEPLEHVSPASLVAYERIYVPSDELSHAHELFADVAAKVSAHDIPTPSLPARAADPSPLASTSVERRGAGQIRIRTEAREDCLLVVAESHFPFWKATVDGAPAALAAAHYGFLGLPLSAGSHEIELRYEVPFWHRFALGLSGVALASVLAALFAGRLRRTLTRRAA